MHAAHELTLVTAVLLGFFGSLHCVAMCGGIVGMLSHARVAARKRESGVAWALLDHAAYSGGRVASYACAGLIVGSLGFALSAIFGPVATGALRVAFGALMIAVGMYVAGWWHGPSPLETAGLRLWRKVSSTTRGLQPADRWWKLLALGAVWGWLPCGLVYGALAAAAATGSAARGALVMLCFGIGTAPALLATGVAAERLGHWTRERGVRAVAGSTIVAFGAWTIIGAATMSHAAHCG